MGEGVHSRRLEESAEGQQAQWAAGGENTLRPGRQETMKDVKQRAGQRQHRDCLCREGFEQ